MERDKMEWDRIKRSEVKWNGIERKGVEWNQMNEMSGMESNGKE